MEGPLHKSAMVVGAINLKSFGNDRCTETVQDFAIAHNGKFLSFNMHYSHVDYEEVYCVPTL